MELTDDINNGSNEFTEDTKVEVTTFQENLITTDRNEADLLPEENLTDPPLPSIVSPPAPPKDYGLGPPSPPLTPGPQTSRPVDPPVINPGPDLQELPSQESVITRTETVTKDTTV